MNRLTYLYSILALALAACAPHEHAATEAQPIPSQEVAQLTAGQIEANQITSGPLLRRVMPRIVHCTGVVDVHPQNRASVMPPVRGFVKAIQVIEGDAVTQGQVLAELTHPDFITLQEQYLKTTGELAFIEKEYARQKALLAQEATARKTFEKLEADLAALKAQRAAQLAHLTATGLNVQALSAETMTDKIAIRAPFAGYVASVAVNAGQLVTPEQLLMTIVNLEHLHAELKVFEPDIPYVRVGSRIVLQSRGGAPQEAYVKLMGQTVDPVSRTLTIHGHLTNERTYLKPGMYVEADILAGTDSTDALPETALVRNDTAYFVFTPEAGGRFRKLPVTVLTVREGYAAVRFPAAPPPQVVLRGAHYLKAALHEHEAADDGHGHAH